MISSVAWHHCAAQRETPKVPEAQGTTDQRRTRREEAAATCGLDGPPTAGVP